jgi:hypothetical protein
MKKGWLDNYGKVENANDSKVSFSENYVGLGNDVKGRKFSPAWGGQFEEGGEIVKAQDGILDKIKTNLNPMNWGLENYSDKGDFNKAYSSARAKGEKEFIFNNKRYSTKMKGTPEQQLKWSGNIDSQMQNQNFLKDRLMNINPRGYEDLSSRVYNAVVKNKSERDLTDLSRIDAYNIYMGKPQKHNTLGISEYKPSVSKDPNQTYFKLNNSEVFDHLKTLITKKNGKDVLIGGDDPFFEGSVMSGYKASLGQDEKGKYISYYDKWDLNPLDFINPITKEEITTDYGKPFEIYDRFYYENNNTKENQPIKKQRNGTSLPGATGMMYARTQGSAPSKGKYAKKTMASAQNGKTTVSTTSPEYKQLYENRQIGRWLDNDTFDSQVPLDEVVVRGNDERVLEGMRNTRQGFLEGVGTAMSFPQQEMMRMATGKRQSPSEAWGFDTTNNSWYHPKSISNFAMDAILDPTNLVGVGLIDDLSKGAIRQGLQQTGEYLTTQTPLRNTYKINPYAFKPNPEMGYRMLGKEGYQDAIESGVLRAKPVPNQPINGGISLARNTNKNPNTGRMQPALDRPYFADGFIDERYAADYMAAVNKADNNLVPIPTHKGIAPSQAGNIPLKNATLYKKDWLKGYKEIPKPTSSVDDVGKGFKSEIDWAKWNKEIPENKALMQEYNAIEQQAKATGTWMKNPDGSAFQGTPEQFVQQNSENFKKAFPKGSDISYRGDLSKISELKSQQELGKEAIKRKYNLTDEDTEALEKLWSRAKDRLNSGKYTTNDYEAALKYAKGDKDKVLSLYTDIRNPKFTDTGESFRVLEKDRQKLLSEGYDALITKPSSFYPEGENVLLKTNQIKSAVGNSGMFDMTNPNIYKGIVPAGIATALSIDQKRNGGIVEDDMGYWNPDNHGKPVRVNSNVITMEGVYEPLLGISDTGDTKLMKPGKNYKFKGKKVTEFPIARLGINQLDAQPMKKLNQLTNFTNNPDKTNWLDKYN